MRNVNYQNSRAKPTERELANLREQHAIDLARLRAAEAQVRKLEMEVASYSEYLDENDPRYPELLARVTQAVREADKGFEQTGGGSRHWVREWFLPKMREHGLLFTSVGLDKKGGV